MIDNLPSDAGLLASYVSEEDKLSLLTGPTSLKIRAREVSPWEEDYASQFDGTIKRDKNGFFHVTANPDWEPSSTANVDVLKVVDPKRIVIDKLPDSQPADKPLSLFWDQILVAQDDEIDFTFPNPGPDVEQEEQKQVVPNPRNSFLKEHWKKIAIGGVGVGVLGLIYAVSKGGGGE